MALLRHKPKFAYSGLTVIMSGPSRFDRSQLLDGVGGHYFEEKCLYPNTNRYACDIRVADDDSPLLPNTRTILLLGQYALRKYTGSDLSLDEQRGSPILIEGIPAIPSFSPQDAVDPFAFEKDYNKDYRDGESVEGEDDDSEDGEGDSIAETKTRQKTKRANFRFWLKQDVKKALKILEHGGIPPRPFEPDYHIWPDADRVIKTLTETKNQHLFFDIETDFITQDMRCFAYAFSEQPTDIFVVPFLDINYHPAYGRTTTAAIWKALYIAIRDNIVVAHNGAHFDFLILARKYRMAVRRAYDTMVAAHRIYPKIEKSLGHWTSLCTYEPFHKDEGNHTYMSERQAEQLYRYCGKDVFTMILIKKYQDEMAAKDPGLDASIKLANRAIRPYLTTCLAGMHYDEAAKLAWMREADRRMTFYMKVIQNLTGPDVPPLISSQKCELYFHKMLGLPVISKTDTGKAQLGAENLLKLAIKYPSPVFKFLLAYREVKKELGTLKFKVYKEAPLPELKILTNP